MEVLRLQRVTICLPTPEVEEVAMEVEEASGHPKVVLTNFCSAGQRKASRF